MTIGGIKLEDVQHFPASRAWWCADCNELSNTAGVCAACASVNGWYMVKRVHELMEERYAGRKA